MPNIKQPLLSLQCVLQQLREGLVERNTGFVVSRVGRGRVLLLGDAIIDSETASLTKYQSAS